MSLYRGHQGPRKNFLALGTLLERAPIRQEVPYPCYSQLSCALLTCLWLSFEKAKPRFWAA